MQTKIPLPELGLDCEKIKACPFHTKDTIGCSYCNEDNMYNTRTAENEKSVLVIDEEKLEDVLLHWMSTTIYSMIGKGLAKHLSQNAKSFMRIEKE